MHNGLFTDQTVKRQQQLIPSRIMNAKILLIDDEPEICQLLQAILARQGFVSSSAHSLMEARERLRSGWFDGVFLDVNLPDGRGYELIPELKTIYPHVRVIVISAMDQERNSAMNAGADLFLPKPLDLRTILGSLKDLGLSN